MNPVSVLVVDDSAVVRQVITAILERDPLLKVQAAVADPLLAQQRMKLRWPDVIVLDIEMPRMDGLTFLRWVMGQRPTPVVICSSLATRGARTTMEALAAGAVAALPKPRWGARGYLMDASEDLIEVVKAAAHARMSNLAPPARATVLSGPGALPESTHGVIALGTSTGGTQALESVLSALPRTVPGIVAVQHMPERFTAAFADRLASVCQIEVREARDGDRVLPGRALIAPGGRHMELDRSGANYCVRITEAPPVNRHRPSVDVLFNSVARVAGRSAVGIIMTGMGDDGALGLRAMRMAGAMTLAQDEASCVVFGMPKEAIRLEAAQRVVPLAEIPREILACSGRLGM